MRDMKAQSKSSSMEVTNNNSTVNLANVRSIIVACDAGMGSSAMGAGVLAKKIRDAGLLDINVTNMAINDLPTSVDIVITHKDLTERAKTFAPNAMHISLANFLDGQIYNDLVTNLIAKKHPTAANDGRLIKQTIVAANDEFFDIEDKDEALFTLSAKHIYLNLSAQNKTQAIQFAGQKLVEGGYVEPDYIEAMLAREKLTSTYLGESIAVPHGTIEAKDRVLKTGIVICQYPEGVQFGDEPDEIARLVIGIAAQNNEHIEVITRITSALDEDGVIDKLCNTQSIQEVLEILASQSAA